MPIPRARTRPRPRTCAGRSHLRPIDVVVLAAALGATSVGCGRVAATTAERARPNPAVAGSVVAAAAAPATTEPDARPAAAIAFGRDGTAVAVQNFKDGQVPDGDWPVWTCRYFAIEAAPGSTLGLGPDFDGGPVTPSPSDLVLLTCPSGHEEIFVFDPARPFGTWTP